MKRYLAIVSAVTLTACSAAGLMPHPAAQSAASGDAASNAGKAELIIRIKIPRGKHNRHRLRPAYVSPSTKGMIVVFTGPSKVSEAIGLTPSSPGCASGASGTVCTEKIALSPCSSKGNCYIGSVATYDAVSCSHRTCTIPSSAHVLSTDQNVGFSIARARSNALNFALAGIPASVALLPGMSSTLSGNSTNGFSISKCVTARQSVNVVGVDADGNDIVGRGAPGSPALTSDDTTHLAVTAAPPGSNTFELVPPASLVSATIPNARTVVHLNASVTPLPGAGAPTQSSHIDVTFNTDLCGVVSEYAVPTSNSSPSGIVAGPDGAMWFTEQTGSKLGRITTSGTVTGEFATPTGNAQPILLAAGPDGALWFTEQTGNNIGRSTTAGAITEYPIPTANSGPFGIVSGPDGALWFAEGHGNNIGRITTAGVVTNEYPVPTAHAAPLFVAVGPDANLWFTELVGNKVGNVTAGGFFTEYASGANPLDIATGPDGALWFTENANTSNAVVRVTTGGTMTQTSIPTVNSSAAGITQGPDGALWFTEGAGNKVGRILTGGTITNEYPVLTAGAQLEDIAPGPDGALWFTEAHANNIGRLQ